MARVFSLKKRIFSLDIEKWREMRRKGKYLRYYIKPVKDGRNALARSIDFYGPLAAVLLATWVLAGIYAGGLLKALAVSLPLMAVEVYAAFRIRKIFRENAAVHARLWRAGRQCQERIRNIGSARELEKLVVEILEKIDGFTDVHLAGTGGRKEKSRGGSVAARALLNGVPVAVGCLPPAPDGGQVTADRVLKFREEVKSLDYRVGILVSTGFFSGEARRAALEDRKRVRLILLDLYGLVELARESGHRIFPDAGPGRITAGEAGAGICRRLFRKALAREKARGYFYAACMIAVMYMMTRPTGVFGPGYIFFGAVNLVLSMYCLVSNNENDLLARAKTK
ncbi:MAG: restriction endonuclease [Peptococcaceae bacterium]|nr:restriction endonuclease [Peptococcaceae bacterium]